MLTLGAQHLPLCESHCLGLSWEVLLWSIELNPFVLTYGSLLNVGRGREGIFSSGTVGNCPTWVGGGKVMRLALIVFVTFAYDVAQSSTYVEVMTHTVRQFHLTLYYGRGG